MGDRRKLNMRRVARLPDSSSDTALARAGHVVPVVETPFVARVGRPHPRVQSGVLCLRRSPSIEALRPARPCSWHSLMAFGQKPVHSRAIIEIQAKAISGGFDRRRGERWTALTPRSRKNEDVPSLPTPLRKARGEKISPHPNPGLMKRE